MLRSAPDGVGERVVFGSGVVIEIPKGIGARLVTTKTVGPGCVDSKAIHS